MPGGDRTGPLGAGPTTGRRAGYCAGFEAPGYANPALRRWQRFGSGYFSRGWGWRNWFYATGQPGWLRAGYASLTPEQELAGLKEEAGWLKDQLEAINRRIGELEKKSEE